MINIFGLILNVAGATIFLIDSGKHSAILSVMMQKIAEGFGLWDQKQFTEEEKKQLEKRIKESKVLSYCGYSLFLTGFLLQLLAAFKAL